MTSGWPWALNELSDRLSLRISQSWTLVTVPWISCSKILFVARCFKSSNPQLSTVLEQKGPHGGLFCQLMFGSKSWANRDILKGNCIFSLQFSGHKFRWWAHLLVSKIHSFPPNDEWHKHSEPQGLGPGAAATHLTMEREVVQSCPALCNPIDCSLP